MLSPELMNSEGFIGDHYVKEFFCLRSDETVGEALHRIRHQAPREGVVYFYVTDKDGVLKGIVNARSFIVSTADSKVAEVMNPRVLAVKEHDNYREALHLMVQHQLLALPVVDSHGKLSGVVDLKLSGITAADLELWEAKQDLFQLVGLHLGEDSLHGPLRVLRSRLPWLMCNVVGGFVGALIAALFSGLLGKVIALTFFIPLVLTVAEGVAMQATAMSLGRMRTRHFQLANSNHSHSNTVHWKNFKMKRSQWYREQLLILREANSGLILGACCGTIAGAVAGLFVGELAVVFALSFGIALSCFCAATLGHLLPRVIGALKLDPQIASGPLALAFTDLAALACYFSVAYALSGSF